MPNGNGGGLPSQGAVAKDSGNKAPNTPVAPCAKPVPAVSQEEQKALDALGPLSGKSQNDIEADLQKQGYTGVKANSGGKVYTKDLGNGRVMAVRLDPAMQRNPPKGFADETPHAHKETLPTAEVSNGNYKPSAKGLMKFDDAGQPSGDPRKVHIPTK